VNRVNVKRGTPHGPHGGEDDQIILSVSFDKLMPKMFLMRLSRPAAAAVKLTWSRTLTSTSHIAALATTSGRGRLKKTSSVPRRMLQTSFVNAYDGASDSEDPTPTIPAWLDIDPAVVEDVLGEVTLKKFQFRQAFGEVAYLQKTGFPFPEEKITREQLETLISLRTRRCRNMYVHALSGAEGCQGPGRRRQDGRGVAGHNVLGGAGGVGGRGRGDGGAAAAGAVLRAEAGQDGGDPAEGNL